MVFKLNIFKSIAMKCKNFLNDVIKNRGIKKLFFQIFIAMLPLFLNAQNSSSLEVAKEKDVQKTVIEILAKAGNNYDGMLGSEVSKGDNYIMYTAPTLPKMYAQKYYITNVLSNKRNYYVAIYSVPQDVKFAKSAIMNMQKIGGNDWRFEKENTSNGSINIINLYLKNAKIGQLREDYNAKVLSFTIGLFDNEIKSTTTYDNGELVLSKAKIKEELKIFEMPTHLADGTPIPEYCGIFGLPPIQQIAPVIGSNKISHHIDAPGTAGIKSYGSNLADTLMYLHSIANYDFEGMVNREKYNYYPFKEYYSVSQIFNTEVSCGDNFIFGLNIIISFNKINQVEQALKEVQTFYENLVKSDSRYIIKTFDKKIYLYENGNPIFEYYTYDYDKHHKPKDLQIGVYPWPNYKSLDEKTYNGHFPSTIKDSWEPQIWELKGKGFTKDSYQRFNGLFKNGELKWGEKTFHGYGPFYDGTWQGSWTPSTGTWDKDKIYVTFIPEGVNDTLGGKFKGSNMLDFTLDYTSSFSGAYEPSFLDKVKINSWTKNGYANYIVRKVDQQNKEFAKYNAEVEERIEYRKTHPTNNNNSNTVPIQNSSICVCCHGLGTISKYDGNNTYQRYDHGTKVGESTHSINVTCTCCHGTGH